MENTPSDLSASAVNNHCPYLGLQDDRFTALAFPSNWNFCYRAKPPASIVLSHQSEACLNPQYVYCPVYLRTRTGPLPHELRGTASVRVPSRGLGLLLLLLLLILLAAGLFYGPRLLAVVRKDGSSPASPQASATFMSFSVVTQTPNQVETALASWTNPALIIPTSLPTSTPTVNLTETTATPTGTNTLTVTPSNTLTPTNTPNLTATQAIALTMTMSPYASGTCGHSLDVSFGTNPAFVIHQLERGANLNMYANKYQTTTDAILAINYHLSMPVQPGWVIVIPVGTSNVSKVPPFELYQAANAVMSTDEMARKLGTDPQLLRQYNAFVEPCTMFSGWMLVPRVQATATTTP